MNTINNTQIYLIDCITNLHAGSGDESYGIIDKRVQRDTAGRYPVIHASSLKGALREFIESFPEYAPKIIDNKKTASDFSKYIFGTLPSEPESNQGNYIFYSANLLSIPVRSNVRPYFNCFSPQVLSDYLELSNLLTYKTNQLETLQHHLNIPVKPEILFGDYNNSKVILESYEATTNAIPSNQLNMLKQLMGDSPAFFNNEQFESITNNLPVIARNQLNNGISANLWYEEVVPRKSRFYFAVTVPNTESDTYFTTFDKLITNNIIQIGGNATVGYGYCKILNITQK